MNKAKRICACVFGVFTKATSRIGLAQDKPHGGKNVCLIVYPIRHWPKGSSLITHKTPCKSLINPKSSLLVSL